MNTKELLEFCLKNGLLVDEEVLSLFSDTSDTESAKILIEKIKNSTGTRVITKKVFVQNKEMVNAALLELPEESREGLEKFKIKLGLSIEIEKEVSQPLNKEKSIQIVSPEEDQGVKIISMSPITSKKLEVKDFVTYFRGRLNEMKTYLQNYSSLDNLVSINKISGNRQGVSIIGIVYDKRVTKNKNIILDVEDMTGKIKVLISNTKPELYEKAEDITLDSVLGFRCSGNKEILFANDLIFPDSHLEIRKRSPVDEYALFIGDLHVGSKLFMEENFLKFIDYLNKKVPNTPEVEKIKYLVVIGDLIAGVGIYPGQQRELVIPDVEEQYAKVAELLGKIRKDIKIVLVAGNHDALRIMEPQPLLDEKYAWPLYNLKNVILTTNPSLINLGAKMGFSGFNVLLYHGYSFHYYASYIPKLVSEKAVHRPELIMEYLLKNRHLAPTHSSTLYFPSEKDPLFIRQIPDIFIAGHTHKSAVSYHNNILMISCSAWESLTAFQEKMGNQPDFCKVPMFNLRTRAIKILDFE